MVVALHHGDALVGTVFLQLLLGHLGESGYVLFADGVELLVAPVLVGGSGAGDGVSLVVTFGLDVGTEFVIVDFVAILALGLLARFFHQFELRRAMLLDFLVRDFESLEKFSFRNFVHLSLYHHYIVVGGAYHQFDVGVLDLLECRVDYPLAVDAGHADLRDRTVERHVAAHQGRGCGDAGECVGRVVFIGRI